MNMKNLHFTSVLVCFFLLCAGNAIGWAITQQVAGSTAGINFLFFGGMLTTLIFFFQILAFCTSRNRLSKQLMFRAVGGFSIAWFMLSLALPIFWIQDIELISKISLAAVSISLVGANIKFGIRQFEENWSRKTTAIEEYINRNSASSKWCKVEKILGTAVDVYIPGVPNWMNPIISISILAAMILGLNLRKSFPTFSVFAWGIPCIIVVGIIMQMIAVLFLQAVKVNNLEQKFGFRFRSSER